MAMVRWHRESELGNRVASVGKQALLEGGIGPGLCDHPRAVFWNPLLFDDMFELVDCLARLQPALFKGGLDGIDTLFERSGAADVERLVHGVPPSEESQYRKSKKWRRPYSMHPP